MAEKGARSFGKARRARAWLGLAVWLAMVVTCDVPDPEPLVFEQRGCVELTRQGVCELGAARTLSIWAQGSELHLKLDGIAVSPARASSVQAGTAVTLVVPSSGRRLTLVAGERSATLTFASESYPAALEAARAARSAGKVDLAERALDGLAARAEHDLCFAARIRSQRARLAFSRGQTEAAEAFYRASLPALLGCGRVSEAAADGFALFYLLGEQERRFDAAERVLDELVPALEGHADDLAWHAYYGASLSLRRGMLRHALEQLRVAHARGERLGSRELMSAASSMEAWLLGMLGRHDLSAETTERALAMLAGGACDRAAMLSTAAFQRLLAVEAGQAELPAVHGLLDRAEALLAGECDDRQLRARTLANRAEVQLLAGELPQAHLSLARAEAEGPPDDRGLHDVLLELRGRVHLRSRAYETALVAYDALLSRVLERGASVFAAQLGRGLALSGAGRPELALTALEAAERALVVELAQVPLSAGRESFVLGREALAQALVRTHLALDNVEGARDAARRARARVLASMPDAPSGAQLSLYREIERLREEMAREEARAWAVPDDRRAEVEQQSRARKTRLSQLLDELPHGTQAHRARVPERGELVLVVFPDVQGAHVFAQTEHKTVHARVAGPGDVLGAVSQALEQAETVTLIAPEHGAYAGLERAAHGELPLALQLPVRHALDVPSADPAENQRGTLVVLDPRGDLRGAGRVSRAHGADARVLRGDAATHEALLAMLDDVARFHYAGHARFSEREALEGALLLAGGSELTAADVLGLTRAPAHVVLSACDSASTRTAGYAAGLGLAHAFVLRGAKTVIATRSAVDDESAHVFDAALAAADPNLPESARFRSALLALHGRGLAWEGYRLLVP